MIQMRKKVSKKYASDEQLKFIETQFNQKSLNVNFNNFNKHKYYLGFQYIQTLSFKSLYFIECYEPSILEIISQPNYTKLKILKLSFNQIMSLEGIISMDCAILQHLDLSNNALISIKPLRKFIVNDLKQLNLCHNHIQDGVQTLKILNQSLLAQKSENIADLKLQKIEGYQLMQDYRNIYIQNCRINDLSQLVKVKSLHLETVYITQKNRIFQQKLQKCLSRKFSLAMKDFHQLKRIKRIKKSQSSIKNLIFNKTLQQLQQDYQDNINYLSPFTINKSQKQWFDF